MIIPESSAIFLDYSLKLNDTCYSQIISGIICQSLVLIMFLYYNCLCGLIVPAMKVIQIEDSYVHSFVKISTPFHYKHVLSDIAKAN